MSATRAGSGSRSGGAGHVTGLIVGRFDPPHLGHSYMIEQATLHCEELVVFVNSSAERDVVPGDLRARWLAELHPEVRVDEVRHRLATDFSDEALWQRWMELFRSHWPHDEGPDVVFSSDPYVDELARRFEAVSLVVDADRETVPVSATMIRADPGAHLELVAPEVRAWIEQNWL